MRTIRDTELFKVLKARDGGDDDSLIEWLVGVADTLEGTDPEDILQEEFGLEPDYVFDLIDIAAGLPE